MHDGKLLTREIAERFLEDEHAVDLPGCTAIETAAAEILSKYRGDLDLDLDGLTSLSDAAAKSFREYNSGLSLNGLTELSCAAAQSLSRSERLYLDGLKELPVELARALVDADNVEVMRNVNPSFTNPPRVLSLNGLKLLSDSSARELAALVGDLLLNGLIGLTTEAAYHFANRHTGRLELGSVIHISDEGYRVLCGFPECEFELGQQALESLDPRTVEEMNHQIHQIALARRWANGDFSKGEPYADFHGNFVYRVWWPYETLDGNAALYLAELEELTVDLSEVIQLDPGVAQTLFGGNLQHIVLDGLSDLSVELAKAIAEAWNWSSPSWVKLSLNGLNTLSEAAAQALVAIDEGIDIEEWVLLLDGLEELPPEVAAALTGRRSAPSDFFWHHLSFNKLTSLSIDTARVLAWHDTDSSSNIASLSLAGLATLSDDLAVALSEHVGELLLDGVSALSETAAAALANHGGWMSDDWLSLDGLSDLPAAVAAAITGKANHGGTFAWHNLSLNGLTVLSPESARAFASAECGLRLNGLTALPVPVAESLAQHVGDLDLNGVLVLSDKARATLTKHEGKVSFNGLRGPTRWKEKYGDAWSAMSCQLVDELLTNHVLPDLVRVDDVLECIALLQSEAKVSDDQVETVIDRAIHGEPTLAVKMLRRMLATNSGESEEEIETFD